MKPRLGYHNTAAHDTYEQALASFATEPMGAHAYWCSACQGWHVQSNISRDWAKYPMGSKPGPKPRNTKLDPED